MKHYTYYPGCSAEATAAPLGVSVAPVAKKLDMELIELEDWNCCGSTPYWSVDKLEAAAMATRNLALAEKRGFDLVTPCSNCFVILNSTNDYLKELPDFKEKVDKALAAGKMEYNGGVKVRHLAEVLYTDITPDGIAAKVTKPLKGLKVGAYYGCQLVRPDGFDDPESPHSLDEIITSLGADAVDWEMKARCCGSSLVMPEQEVALGLVNKLLKNATKNGVECLITPCPLCQINLDAYQSVVNSQFKTNYNIPVLFVTQLIGVAMGIPAKELALSGNIVSPMKVLAPYL
ncbi:MAG: disulfide reductase [Dehalococcoidia bacterium]|nr:disulfide reductase [Dehalococcoidia bacterium]